MDGWITIGTKLNTDKFDSQISDLENKIKNEEEKQQINIQATSQLEEEQARITREVEELTQAYTQAANEADRLKSILNTTKTGSYENFVAKQAYEEQVAKVDQINAKLDEANVKNSKIAEKVAKSNLQYQTSVDKVEKLKNQISLANIKQQQLNAKAQELQFKEVEKSINNMKKGLTGAIGQITKMALAVLSIRSAYMMVRQASSTLAQYNKQYATDLEYIRFVIAQGIAPVLEKVVSLAQTLMAYINYLTQRLLGVNLFAKGSAEEFKKAKDNMSGMAKSSKEIKNNLASFDELNVLDSDTGAAGEGALAPSIDIGGLEDVEIPEWLEKIGDYLEPIGKLTENVQTMFSTIMAGAEALWKAISPMIDTITNYVLPVLIGFATEVAKTFTTLFNTISSLLSKIWNTGIKPAIELIMKIWDSAWQSIKGAWDKWGSPIFEKLRTAIEKTGELFQTLWERFLQPIWENLLNAISWLWDKHLKPLWDNLLDFFGVVINGILQIWNETLEPLLQYMIYTFSPFISEAINLIVNVIGTVLAVAADVISAIITILKGLVEFIVGVFTGDWEQAWQGIKDIFKGIWDGIVAIVKGAINLVIDFINGMIAGIEKAMNWIVDKINSLEINNPFTGEEIWSPNVPYFEFGRIPKLARGGIIAKPTQAIIGESGREAVMPLDNNTEWMDMLAEKLGARGNENITIRFTGTAAQLVRMLKPELEQEEKRTGKRIIVGGAY